MSCWLQLSFLMQGKLHAQHGGIVTAYMVVLVVINDTDETVYPACVTATARHGGRGDEGGVRRGLWHRLRLEPRSHRAGRRYEVVQPLAVQDDDSHNGFRHDDG